MSGGRGSRGFSADVPEHSEVRDYYLTMSDHAYDLWRETVDAEARSGRDPSAAGSKRVREPEDPACPGAAHGAGLLAEELDKFDLPLAAAVPERANAFLGKRGIGPEHWLHVQAKLDLPSEGVTDDEATLRAATAVTPFTSRFMAHPDREADLVQDGRDPHEDARKVFLRTDGAPQRNPWRTAKQARKGIRWMSCGLFTVEKKNGLLRLIIDARNANMVIPRIEGLLMFELEQLLSAMSRLPYAWTIDFRHFFYQLPITRRLAMFFSFKFGETWCIPRALPMGYHNAPLAAQAMSWLVVLFREETAPSLGVEAVPARMPQVLRVRCPETGAAAEIFVLLDNIAVFAETAEYRDRWAARIAANMKEFNIRGSARPTVSDGTDPFEFCGVLREASRGASGVLAANWRPTARLPPKDLTPGAEEAQAVVASVLGTALWVARVLQLDPLEYEEMLDLMSTVGRLRDMPRREHRKLVLVTPAAADQVTRILQAARAAAADPSRRCHALRVHFGRPATGRAKALFGCADARPVARAAVILDPANTGSRRVVKVVATDRDGVILPDGVDPRRPPTLKERPPDCSSVSELSAVLLLVATGTRKGGPYWQNGQGSTRNLFVAEDNTGVERAISRGYSRSKEVRALLRELRDAAAAANIRILTCRVSTDDIVADIPTRDRSARLFDEADEEASHRLHATCGALLREAARKPHVSR